MTTRVDVAVVGGGPAGLATAIATARAGLATIVVERRPGPPDKACGEGVMPAGVGVLERLGVRELLTSNDVSPFDAIRYVETDGSSALGRLPSPGLGIRRTALTAALARRAGEAGAELLWGCVVEGVTFAAEAARLRTAEGGFEAGVVVAADGLHSRLRLAAGLLHEGRVPRRFGIRQHFRLAPWSRAVEVHLGDGVEAFLTPVGSDRIGLAFLWDTERTAGPTSIDAFLARFPAVAARLRGAPAESRPRGAGPFAQAVRARTADRLVLVGDAAGYVDAISGEGLSLAFVCAEALGAILPGALARGAGRETLGAYERVVAREYRRYAAVCHTLLAIARHPRLRRRIVRQLARHPRLFERLIGAALA